MVIQLALLLINIILINVVFLLSFFIRYGTNIPQVNFLPYKENFAFLAFIYLLAFVFVRLFKKRFISYWDIFKRVFNGLFFGTLFVIAVMYILRSKWSSFPSSIFIISFPVGLALIFTINAFVLRCAGKIKKRVIVIGKENIVDVLGESSLVEVEHVDKIEDILFYDEIDEIIICRRIPEDAQMNLLTFLLLKLKVNVVFSPALYAELLSENIIQENSIQFLKTFIGRKSECEEFFIRAFDVLISIVILVLLSPVMIFIMLLIKFVSCGSIFYKQTRVAKDGGVFALYKFRTMVENAESQSGPVLATKDDIRIIKFGKFLRSTRLDELPQLLNVIRGDMSIVGPRPERPHFVKRHKVLREIRLAVKPGLTGLAQIRGIYDLHPKHKIKYDYLYIQKRSLLLNLYIIANTIPVVLFKKGI